MYQGDKLIDTYTTNATGQFTTDYYPCGDNWSIREVTPSEGYLLDTTSYRVGAEFVVYLKSAGSYEAARKAERDYLFCDENGFAQTKGLPYGVYTVHQVSGWEGRELLADFDVYIAKDGQTYRYPANNVLFESYIKIVKVDAETGKTIPYAGAGFQIFRPDGSKVSQTFTYPTATTIDTFYTNSEGYLITPEPLEYGTGYYLVEVAAPFGYVLDSAPVYFDVTEDNAIKDDGLIVVEVTKANMAQKGVIKINKTGEVFSDEDYPDNKLTGAEFDVYQDSNGNKEFDTGDKLLGTLTEVSTGIYEMAGVEYGGHFVKERTAPNGFRLDENAYYFEINEHGKTVVVENKAGVGFVNDAQAGSLKIVKTSSDGKVEGFLLPCHRAEWLRTGIYHQRGGRSRD